MLAHEGLLSRSSGIPLAGAQLKASLQARPRPRAAACPARVTRGTPQTETSSVGTKVGWSWFLSPACSRQLRACSDLGTELCRSLCQDRAGAGATGGIAVAAGPAAAKHAPPDARWRQADWPDAPPPPPPRTKWTRRVLHPVLIGHAASNPRWRQADWPSGLRWLVVACPLRTRADRLRWQRATRTARLVFLGGAFVD
jgi:hypothetical protein